MLCHFWAQWLSVTYNLNLSHSHIKMLKHYLPCMPNATKSSGDWTHPGSSQLAALTLHSRKRQWIVKLTGTLFHVPTQLVGTQTPMNVLHCSNAAPLPSYQESYKLNYGQGHIFNEILSYETNSSWWISLHFDCKSRRQTLWVTRVHLGLGSGALDDAHRSYTNWWLKHRVQGSDSM